MFQHLVQMYLPVDDTPRDVEIRTRLFESALNRGERKMSLNGAMHVCRELGMFEVVDPTDIVLQAFDSCIFTLSAETSASSPTVPVGLRGSDDEALLPKAGFRMFLVYLKKTFDLYQVFDAIDTSKDKRISVDELANAAKQLRKIGIDVEDATKTFRAMDVDRSGVVDFHEFADWILRKQLAFEQHLE